MKKEIICIGCPKGCKINVEMQNDEITSISGNSCPRGAEYATAECKNPVRVITTTVKTSDGSVIPVKTSKAVPKDIVFECMKKIDSMHPDISDCSYGYVICKNILNTGADVLITAPVRK